MLKTSNHCTLEFKSIHRNTDEIKLIQISRFKSYDRFQGNKNVSLSKHYFLCKKMIDLLIIKQKIQRRVEPLMKFKIVCFHKNFNLTLMNKTLTYVFFFMSNKVLFR
jgi:hypothetical protein